MFGIGVPELLLIILLAIPALLVIWWIIKTINRDTREKVVKQCQSCGKLCSDLDASFCPHCGKAFK